MRDRDDRKKFKKSKPQRGKDTGAVPKKRRRQRKKRDGK